MMKEFSDQAFDSLDSLDWQKGNGLIPAVVQNASNGQVLMLGYMSPESLKHTLDTGQVTFFSRSRNQLWTKGETSGNTLVLVSIKADCDQDTLLIEATPHGPTCHTGSTTCFGELTTPAVGFLAELEQIIQSRKGSAPETSYTAKLLAEGVKRCAQKVGEEGVEVALAAVANDQDELKEESADLLYHLLVLLAANDSSLDEVLEVLRARHVNRP